MDLISHGLWGGLVLGRRRSFLGAALFGLLPDVLAFAPYLVLRAVRGGLPDVFVHPRSYPQWVLLLYNSSHSLVAAGLIFIVLRRWRPRLAIPFLAWPLHILMDIPTHSADNFPTKFLFPLSGFHFDGVHWRSRHVFLANWTAVVLAYVGWAVYRKLRETTVSAPSGPKLFQTRIYPAGMRTHQLSKSTSQRRVIKAAGGQQNPLRCRPARPCLWPAPGGASVQKKAILLPTPVQVQFSVTRAPVQLARGLACGAIEEGQEDGSQHSHIDINIRGIPRPSKVSRAGCCQTRNM